MLRPSPKHLKAAAAHGPVMTTNKDTDMTTITMTSVAEVTPILFPLALWLRRARTRRHFRALEAHRLADVGLTAAQRSSECAKWFWEQ